jgi:hypothetical protein
MNNFSNNYIQNQSDNYTMRNNLENNNQLNNMLTNEHFINMSNNIDSLSIDQGNYNNLNGTNLDDLSPEIRNKDNNTLIESITKEVINNIKENNIDFYDNVTIQQNNSDDKKSKKHKSKKKTLKDDFQNYVESNNPLPSTNGYLSYIFDDCFNYKDFILLFALYFLLSQEMIKDFFAKYFTSLNPNEEGRVNIQGVIIYGLILTILYMLSKKFINNI